MGTEKGNGKHRAGVSLWLYALTVFIVAAGTVGVMMLRENIATRKAEGQRVAVELVHLTEDTIDPAEWGKNFPRQYDSYKRTVDIERTKHGGSEAFQKLDEFPVWRTLFKGYAFSVDYREERGHAYMLQDQEETLRVTDFKQPGACLHCHSSVLPAYLTKGKEALPGGGRQEQIMKGFEIVNAMPYEEAHKLVTHPISCVDCHDPESMALRITRPGFVNGIAALAASDYPVPQMPSIERWRKEGKKGTYDANKLASRQEMRSFVCGQCHVEYYFKGDGKYLTYPWHNGLRMEDAEKYYDEVGHKDWTHPDSGALMLKAQHPEFEMWSTGVHSRSGVACADCHMPYIREGAIKVSDHHVRSPLLNISRSCQVCHSFPESELLARAETIQDRTAELLHRGEQATLELVESIKAAREAGATDDSLNEAMDLHRKAQWRLDFVAAENSMGFHSPGEAARILGEAIDYARQGEVAVLKAAGS